MTDNKDTILNDEPTNDDKLGRKKYAEALAKIAETCDPPLAIGLYGGWGIGKTSLMELIENELNLEEIHPVWINTWQHQFDDEPALALIHMMAESMGGEIKEEVKKLLSVIAGAFGSMILKATTTINASDIDALGKRYEKEHFQVREKRALLRENLEKLIQKVLGNEKKRIVFFIDDLDRCMPATALGLLEALKLYLNLPECVFFLGVDKTVLEMSIKHHYKDIELSDTEYLDKIIQLPFNIPPINKKSMGEYLDSLSTFEDLEGCKELLIEGLDDNPRQAKRFINTLKLNHFLAKEIKGYDPKLLVLILLIQDRSIGLYRQLPRHPEILLKLHEESLYKKSEKKSQHYEDYISGDEGLEAVLKLVDIPEVDVLKEHLHLTKLAGVAEDDIEKKISTDLWVDIPEVAPVGEDPTGASIRGTSLLGFGRTRFGQAGFGQGKIGKIGADLEGADLFQKDMSRKNLQNATLRNATLAEANLIGANLIEANLIRANLIGADLIRANLTGANLTGAYLIVASLEGAILTGADLKGAILTGANLKGTDLTGVIGLTKGQLESAITDKETILPDYLKEK